MGDFVDEFLNWDVIRDLFPELVTEAMKNTVVFTVLGFSFGLVLALVVALMRISRTRLLRWPAAVYTDVLRGLPLLLTIIFIGYGIPIATGWQFPFPRYFPGTLALAVVGGAYMAETIRAGIEAVPRGQMEAARSLGMPYRTAMRRVVLPQAFRIIIPPLTNELILLFKDTALLAVLGTEQGGKEITKFVRDATNLRSNTSPLVAGGLAYLVITIPLTQLVAWMERRGKRSR